MYFNRCESCGAYLDPGERCDCEKENEQERKRLQKLYVKEGKSDQLAFNLELDKARV